MNSNDLRRVFHSMDKNGDGMVCLDELKDALEKVTGMRFNSEELESVVGKVTLNVDEFLCFYRTILCTSQSGSGADEEEEEEEEEEELVEAFNVFDENRDGFISCEELESALMRLGMCDGKKRDFKSMICVYDLDSDGKLDFHEFKTMMKISRPAVP